MSRLATTITLTLVVTLTIVHHALSLNCKCGKGQEGVGVTTRVVGGTKVPAGKYPWLVIVENRRQHTRCTGAIINNKYVLAASHCVDEVETPDDIIVYHSLTQTEIYYMMQMKKETQQLKVIGYPKKTYVGDPGNPVKDDIALLKLEKELEFTETFTPICLTPQMDHADYFAAGWGLQEAGTVEDGKIKYPVLTMADQGRLDLAETPMARSDPHDAACAAKEDSNNRMWLYGSIGGRIDETKPWDPKQVTSGMCPGDSGGPLMTRKDGRVYTVGIASAADCNADQRFAKYEKTLPHKDWIKENTKDAEWCEGSEDFLA